MLGESGPVRTIVPQVRMPDVGFVSWDHFPNRAHPKTKVIPVAPDFAVEILSQTNTKREMDRKLDEYFQANTRRVWYIDPNKRSARVYTAREQFVEISGEGMLDGGDVLPGFSIKLADLFAEADGPEGESGS
jgi:Uma2 family endonuclease